MNVWIIAGLGNPGNRYKFTRHNIGFLVLDALADKRNVAWQKKKYFLKKARNLTARYSFEGQDILLVKPLLYMNRSGQAIGPLVNEYSDSESCLIVVHDDLDLPFERMKLKKKGGAGGHRGIESILSALETEHFFRLKMGIGRPEGGESCEEYVLRPFSEEQLKHLAAYLNQGVDALETVISHGINYAMNHFNRVTS